MSAEEGPTSKTGGGYRYPPKEIEELTRLQRRVIWDIVKNIGNALLEGKELVNTALPVYIFEPRSFLERLTDNFGHLYLLTEASMLQILRLLTKKKISLHYKNSLL